MLKPENFKAGAIIKHAPRGTYYRLDSKTLIKSDNGWEEGWIYDSCVEITSNGTNVNVKCDERFSRPMRLFDEDWLFIGYS